MQIETEMCILLRLHWGHIKLRFIILKGLLQDICAAVGKVYSLHELLLFLLLCLSNLSN